MSRWYLIVFNVMMPFHSTMSHAMISKSHSEFLHDLVYQRLSLVLSTICVGQKPKTWSQNGTCQTFAMLTSSQDKSTFFSVSSERVNIFWNSLPSTTFYATNFYPSWKKFLLKVAMNGWSFAVTATWPSPWSAFCSTFYPHVSHPKFSDFDIGLLLRVHHPTLQELTFHNNRIQKH